MHRLTKARARCVAVRAQLLDAPRPNELLTVVQRLTLLQIDPTAAIASSADLVAWAGVVVPSVDEARRARNERRLASLGIARQRSTRMPNDPGRAGGAGGPGRVARAGCGCREAGP